MSTKAETPSENYRLVSKALSSGSFSESDARSAQELLQRSSDPVRLSIVGQNAAPRADIANLIFGNALLPEQAFSGSIQLRFAEQFLCKATKVDREEIFVTDPQKLSDLADQQLVFTEISFPSPVLQRVSVLSLCPPQDREDFQPALRWLLGRTDMLIWYAETWNELDHEFWNMVPARFKDHSYLCSGKDSGVLGASPEFKPSFRSKVVLDLDGTRRAVATGMKDAAALRECGAYDLITAVRNDIRAAKQEIEDRLELLVQNCPDAIEAARKSPDHADQGASECASLTTVEAVSSLLEKPVSYDPADLITALENFGREFDANNAASTKKILQDTSVLMSKASEEMYAAAKTCDATAELKHRTEAASDMLELLSIENNLESCTDGVSLLLQIKRDAQKMASLKLEKASPNASKPVDDVDQTHTDLAPKAAIGG